MHVSLQNSKYFEQRGLPDFRRQCSFINTKQRKNYDFNHQIMSHILQRQTLRFLFTDILNQLPRKSERLFEYKRKTISLLSLIILFSNSGRKPEICPKVRSRCPYFSSKHFDYTVRPGGSPLWALRGCAPRLGIFLTKILSFRYVVAGKITFWRKISNDDRSISKLLSCPTLNFLNQTK